MKRWVASGGFISIEFAKFEGIPMTRTEITQRNCSRGWQIWSGTETILPAAFTR
jgi:hypothetical protein